MKWQALAKIHESDTALRRSRTLDRLIFFLATI
jgi:hypothetical protein